jgi:phosphoribosyl-dephospho-CoA transferase
MTGGMARPHDLVLFAADRYRAALPEWVDLVDGCAWAVVRRAEPPGPGILAAGVRGRSRAERQAIDVDGRDVVRRTSPEELLSSGATDVASPAISRALDVISGSAAAWFAGRDWGPTGAVGFQLATGLPVVHEASDLDLVLRASAYLSPAEARTVLDHLESLPCRVDCSLDTGGGAVALSEWARSGGGDVLLRTSTGPRLTRNPWAGV